jgi:hypothetical protein
VKTLFRKHADGEIVAIFPEEPGTPCKCWAAAYTKSGGFFTCDPATVVANTSPASEFEAKLLAKHLLDEHEIETEKVAKVLKGHAVTRRETDESAHRKFGALRFQA